MSIYWRRGQSGALLARYLVVCQRYALQLQEACQGYLVNRSAHEDRWSAPPSIQTRTRSEFDTEIDTAIFKGRLTGSYYRHLAHFPESQPAP